jgi:hypothetical protein
MIVPYHSRTLVWMDERYNYLSVLGAVEIDITMRPVLGLGKWVP